LLSFLSLSRKRRSNEERRRRFFFFFSLKALARVRFFLEQRARTKKNCAAGKGQEAKRQKAIRACDKRRGYD